MGIISEGGFAAKFLNSLGYFIIATGIVVVRNIQYCIARRRFIQQNDSLEVNEKALPRCATLK